MLFSSNIFLWSFLPIVLIGNYLIKHKYSNIFLLIASLIFYAWGEPVYIILMFFSIFINWLSGLSIDRVKTVINKKLILVSCIVVNILLLGYFKYYDFLVQSFNKLMGAEIIAARQIALPIGISFFTFQALSYVIDLYRGNCKVQKNILNLALYVSFFPQLIAGPIVRYKDIDEQINNRETNIVGFGIGFRRFLYGLGKKVIISNCMAQIADSIFSANIAELSTVAAWLGAIAYMMQIYYDFSGYSDMAIGLGKIFGFDFLENFNYPYLSQSIREFWQRWHISLGTWFKEYVYIPLGGNRKGQIRTFINLMIVFFLTGLWHGANWTFVLWGLYHGFFQIIERVGFGKVLKKSKIFGTVYCLLVVIFGWVLFRADTITDAIRYITIMLMPWHNEAPSELWTIVNINNRSIIIFILAILGVGFVQDVLKNKFNKLYSMWKNSYVEIVYLGIVFAYCIILLAVGTYNPFIYFRF